MTPAPAMMARQFMVTRLIKLPPKMDLFEAIGLLLRHRISGAPVVDEHGQYLGIFSEKSCMKAIVEAAHDSLPCATVDCYLDRQAKTIDEETDLLTIAHIFNETSYRRLPVLRDGQVIGQVSRRDVLRAAHDSLAIAPARDGGTLYLSGLHDRPTPALS